MFVNNFFRRTKLKTVCIAVSFISLFYIFYQLKASEDISKEQLFIKESSKRNLPMNYSLRGVDPSELQNYEPNPEGIFTCIKSGLKILYSKLNDDYCDCPADGSDEPGTNACGFNYFHCSKHFPGDKFILTSRVNDGYCDCCDGSDEYLNVVPPMHLPEKVQKKLGRYLSPCIDRC